MELLKREIINGIKRFIDSNVGCYFDIANCLYSNGYPEQWIRILARDIRNVHVKDYKLSIGNLEGFCNIFEGDVNWKEVCKALREVDYNYCLTSEVLPAFKHYPEHLWKSVSIALDFLIKDMENFRKRIYSKKEKIVKRILSK